MVPISIFTKGRHTEGRAEKVSDHELPCGALAYDSVCPWQVDRWSEVSIVIILGS